MSPWQKDEYPPTPKRTGPLDQGLHITQRSSLIESRSDFWRYSEVEVLSKAPFKFTKDKERSRVGEDKKTVRKGQRPQRWLEKAERGRKGGREGGERRKTNRDRHVEKEPIPLGWAALRKGL